MSEYGNKLPSTIVLPDGERPGEIHSIFDHVAQAVGLETTDLLLDPSGLSVENAEREQNSEGLLALSGLSRVPANGVKPATDRQISEAETPLKPTVTDLGAKKPDTLGYEKDAGIHERDLPFVRLLHLYGNHPSVIKEVEELKKGTATTDSTESASHYLMEMGQYGLIDFEELKLLFKSLDQAIDLLKSLDSTSGISPDDEQVLIDGTIAHRTIYLSNLRLVVHVAKQYPGKGAMTFQDLVQEGNIGLFKAISRFEVERGNQFSTYAINWVRQSITRAIADKNRAIRIPAHRHEQYRQLLNIKTKLGGNPTTKELSDAMGIKQYDIMLLQCFGPDNIASLDEPIAEGGITYLDTITADRLSEPPDSAIGQIADRDLINKMLADPDLNLTDHEKIVLCLRYAIPIEAFEGVVFDIPHHGKLSYSDIMSRFSSADGLILEELGELFGLTADRVRQIEHKAMNKIRGKYHNRDFGVTDYN